MRYLFFVLLLATPALASSSHEAATGAAGTSPAQSHYNFVPVPADPSWISGPLLLALWLTIAAIVLGMLVQYFNLMPKTKQIFADSGHSHATHSASHTTSH